jgi:hypothetical protein
VKVPTVVITAQLSPPVASWVQEGKADCVYMLTTKHESQTLEKRHNNRGRNNTDATAAAARSFEFARPRKPSKSCSEAPRQSMTTTTGSTESKWLAKTTKTCSTQESNNALLPLAFDVAARASRMATRSRRRRSFLFEQSSPATNHLNRLNRGGRVRKPSFSKSLSVGGSDWRRFFPDESLDSIIEDEHEDKDLVRTKSANKAIRSTVVASSA